MHIFIPESIYYNIKDNKDFLEEYKKLNKKFDDSTNCIVEYNNAVTEESQYDTLHEIINSILDEKHRKIWECFCVNINYNEKTEKELWLKSKKIIDGCKEDSDLDVKMYGYYMELANIADHESGEWLTNVQESLEIFNNTKEHLYDSRLYTKYYWDNHEALVFNMKFGSDKYTDIPQLYEKYIQTEKEVTKFLFSKYDTSYFKNIILHKTLYTAIIFWGGINHRTLKTPEQSTEILKYLDRYLSSLEHKYKPFNMHLMEWLWINLKWWMDNDRHDFVKVVFYRHIVPILEEALQNKFRMIKALKHHNFNYTSNFLVYLSEISNFEKNILKNNTVESLPWTEKELKIISENNISETKNWWGERTPNLTNYQKKFVSQIK
jgi:hypothetical protein